MREILFRGKTENGEWFEGSLHKYTIQKPLKTETRYKIQEFNFGYSDENEFECDYMSGFDEEVIPETVGQFTGLTDKNGKKVFEGDIIQFGEDEEYDWEFNIGVVKFGEGTFDSGIYVYTGFFYEDRKGNIDHNTLYDWEEDWERCKVIGNIYDNPNLLNKE